MLASAQIRWKAFSIPKQGNTEDENEDAFQPNVLNRSIPFKEEFTCALSDGATQTTFAALWANLLVEEAARQPVSTSVLQTIVANAQKHWASELSNHMLPWHAAEKVKLGSHATLVWLSLKLSRRETGPGRSWRALAVGDSCLFHIRKDELESTFPINHSSDFNNRPALLSSLSGRNSALWGDRNIAQIEGTWKVGDEFLLVTDALAEWFLSELESGSSPFQMINQRVVRPRNGRNEFYKWITEIREAKTIKNDDTTLVWSRAS